jgi:hypothetical protein
VVKERSIMEIRIGLRNTPREIAFESKQSAAEVEATVSDSINAESKTLKLVDDKGRIFIVPTDALAYVEIGAEEARRVGFIA